VNSCRNKTIRHPKIDCFGITLSAFILTNLSGVRQSITNVFQSRLGFLLYETNV